MKKIMYTFILVLLGFTSFSHVKAAAMCSTRNIDSSKWSYVETITNNNQQYSTVETSTEKRVCCTTGSGQTLQYYCDKYSIVENYTAPEVEEEITSNDLGTYDMQCNTIKGLDSEWKFDKCVWYYPASAPSNKEVMGVEKVYCTVVGSGATQRSQCDYFTWEGDFDFTQKPSNAIDTPFGACGNVGNDWTFNYAITSSTNITTQTDNSKVCCNQTGTGAGTTYLCDVYVDTEYYNDKNGDEDEDIDTSVCSILGGENSDTILIIREIYNYFTWIIPVLIVVLSILDFVKVIGSGDDKDLKAAGNNLIKRIIVGVAFFLVPLLVKLFINISGITENITDGDSIVAIISCVLK
ncbi:MAG: hypothetical protein PHN42_03975 [Bacilli bacterium]|nr:hypothetical protein [Bacilli bacterium]